jgi:PAS domain S-box-containing protein
MADDSFLNAIMQNSTFGYTYNKILLDEDGRPSDYIFLDVNASYERMIGMPRDKIIGKKVSEVIPSLREDSFGWIDCFGKVALTGDKTEFEAFSKAVGRWFHISILSPERLYFVGISFDITDKKEIELQLAQSEEMNRRYIEGAPDGIFITDETGTLLKVNAAASRILRCEPADLIGKHIIDTFHDKSKEHAQRGFEELKRTGRKESVREMLRKDGSFVTVMLDSVKTQEGQYMSFCKDITAIRALRSEKEQYLSVFESIKQPILITDAHGVITAANDAFVDMFGYAREDLLSHQSGKLLRLNGGDTTDEAENAMIAEINRCVADPSCRTWEGVITSHHKDGTIVWIDLLVNGAFDEHGVLQNVLCFPIDVTARRLVENQNRIKLYQTIADLAELRDDETGNHMRRVGIFAKHIAQEFGMSAQFCANIELFAPMHDIGKVGILDSILRAPRKLTVEEFAIMKNHTILGHNIVKGKPELEMAAEITLCHHERFDGLGYPHGITGDKIPLAAQITSLCDVYDALRSSRPYKAPWSHEEAATCIERSAGTQFSPELIGHFSHLKPDFEKIYRELRDLPSSAEHTSV